ncbi:MAG: flagellar hook-basal body complex protein, partial [Selenomonadaceae bacterium]|nr:flagellar hook-basal body complex protein [Selenomonadaceae bacterium]
MMRSLYTGLLGLKSHQTKMDVVGNNISNVNTTGFKAGRATFADMLSQNLSDATASHGTVGSTNPKQIGLGTNVSAIDTIFKDGAPLVTGKNTDLCISGDGLFVVQKGDEIYYTRDGAFEFDAAGNYVLPGSGHFVQGWTATDGVIDPAGAVGNINVQKGQVMAAQATDLVNYSYNLSADVPMITGINGGIHTTATTITTQDVSETNPLPVTFGGKEFTVTSISDDVDMTKKWTALNDIPLGATSADYINEDGDVVTFTFDPAATFEVPAGSEVEFSTNILTKGSVSEEWPVKATIGSHQYTVIGLDKTIDVSNGWSVKSAASVGDTAITITNGTDDAVLTLNSPLTESIGLEQVTVETPIVIANSTNPVTITLSDGTTELKTDGVYKLGNSLPIYTSATVYDSAGNDYQIPVYFVREGELDDGVVSSTNKWLVSLSPDSFVKPGDTTTTEFYDSEGNKITASRDAVEIQFDTAGRLVVGSEEGGGGTEGGEASNLGGMITLDFPSSSTEEGVEPIDPTQPIQPTTQNVALDFSALTQFSGSTTVSSIGNGYTEGV